MSQFNPIDANGFATFGPGGAAGWHQLATPFATLPVLSIVVPPEAQGFIIQATADLRYCYSSGSTDSAADTLTLPAGGTMTVPGQTWLRELCIFAEGTTAFSITFIQGANGPMPIRS